MLPAEGNAFAPAEKTELCSLADRLWLHLIMLVLQKLF